MAFAWRRLGGRFALIREDDLEFVFVADATVGTVGYRRSMQRTWQKLLPLAQRCWFDDVRDRVQAVVFAYESGLVQPGEG